MPHLSISFPLDARLDPDAVEEALLADGAISVTLTDSRDDPVLEPAPGEVRLWPATCVTGLFQAEAGSPELLMRIAAIAGVSLSELRVTAIADRHWEREWLKDFVPLRFGARLWVAPHHATVDDPGAIVVRLDPGLAFGTGTHPSTALCLRWLDAHPPAGLRVIDYGCGSGILALAAARLGARRVDCFDIDPQALIATAGNAAANALSERIIVRDSDTQLPERADLLLANILAAPLCGLAIRFAALVRTGGDILLAGLLDAQREEVTRAYAPWFDVRCTDSSEGWSALSGVRLEVSPCSPSVPSAH